MSAEKLWEGLYAPTRIPAIGGGTKAPTQSRIPKPKVILSARLADRYGLESPCYVRSLGGVLLGRLGLARAAERGLAAAGNDTGIDHDFGDVVTLRELVHDLEHEIFHDRT